MDFYHGTAKKNVDVILKTSLKKSVFSISDYLKYVINNELGGIPKDYLDDNNDYNRVKWLGEGIYLFDSFNKQEALSWGIRYYGLPKDECTALKVNVKNIPEEFMFDMFSFSDIEKMKIMLEDKFLTYLEEREDLDLNTLEKIIYLQTKIIDDLNHLFQKRPFLGGVAIDLYNLTLDNQIKLVRGIYEKRGRETIKYYDVYYCLKDEQYLESVNII